MLAEPNANTSFSKPRLANSISFECETSGRMAFPSANRKSIGLMFVPRDFNFLRVKTNRARVPVDVFRQQASPSDSLREQRGRNHGEPGEPYRSRIRLVLPKLSAAHPELILLASVFQHYKG
jgi:hypothetical protein